MGSRNSKSQIRNLTLILVVLVAIRLVFGLGVVEDSVRRLTAPINRVVESISNLDDDSVADDGDKQKQINKLKADNEKLKQQLKISSDTVASAILKKDVTGIRKTIIVDKGSNQGVVQGAPVLYEGNLIGQIERASNSTSIVILVNDPNFRATAIAEQEEGGVARTIQGSLVFDLAANQELESSFISTDGLDSEFPPGLGIGSLGKRITSEDDTFHTYHVLLPTNIEAVENVSIMKVGD